MMKSTTMDITVGTIEGGTVDDSNVAHSSSAPQANTTSHIVPKGHPTESYIHGDKVIDSLTTGHCVPVDGAAEHDAPDHEASACQVPSYQPPSDYILNYFHKRPYTEVGDSPLCPITFPDTPLDDNFPKIEGSEGMVPAKEMHKFMKLPTELRLMIWEMSIADAKESDHRLFNGCVQRFRFNLAYDAQRVKPGQDKSWGWVACFTPIRINTKKSLIFLRASLDSRTIMLRKMSILTVHELPIDANGQYMAPRKIHVPFNFAKDDFCLEGITHGLEEAQRDKEDKDAIWDPMELPLADLLDNALGLRFAPRIKRLAIVPHYQDVGIAFGHPIHTRCFMETTNGRNMAALAKRFSALVTVKSAIAQQGRCAQEGSCFPGYILWKAASLRGRGQGGPSGMSEEHRDAVYAKAWRRIFDNQYCPCVYLTPDLFDDYGCLMGKKSENLVAADC